MYNSNIEAKAGLRWGCVPSRRGMEHGLSGTPAKYIIEGRSIMLRKEIPDPQLSTVLVYSLGNLVASSISDPRKQRSQFPAQASRRLILENNCVQLGQRSNLHSSVPLRHFSPCYPSMVTHQSLGDRVDLAYQ